jgi:hypothetical protein
MVRFMIRAFILLACFGPMACSDVGFDSLPDPVCAAYQQQYGPGGCVITNNGFKEFNYYQITGELDMLFVDDNSGSMYPEQVEIANRFPGFLDSIYRLDYRIGIITTDITKNGGGLLTFPNGGKFIANNSRKIDTKHSQNVTYFQNTIKRPETLTCDSSGYTNCPSGDERGIYALNLAMARSDQRGFFRAGGHLAVVILSDEDERSNGGNIPGYPLEELDYPISFANRANQYLSATKTISVHSIIIRPGDSGCWSIQNSQNGVKGYYGYSYAALAQPNNALKAAANIVDGVMGSICSNNYTTELGNISAKLNQYVQDIQLPCKPDQNLVTITLDPAPQVQTTYTIDVDNRLHLSPAVQAGTKVNLQFKCKI